MTWQRILDTELKAICICWEGGGGGGGKGSNQHTKFKVTRRSCGRTLDTKLKTIHSLSWGKDSGH